MGIIKKYGVWIALVFTLAATVWVSRFEENENQINIAGGVAQRFNQATKTIVNPNNSTTRELLEKQMNASALLIQRPIITENPQNIFTTLVRENTSEKHASDPLTQSIVNPFVYAGKLVEDGKVVVFLIDGDNNHAVKSGDVIEEMWQVKSIVPPLMVLKNIPSKIEMQLQIGPLN